MSRVPAPKVVMLQRSQKRRYLQPCWPRVPRVQLLPGADAVRPAAADAAPARPNVAPQCGGPDASSLAPVPTTRPASGRLTGGRRQGTPKPQVRAGWLGRGDQGTHTHTKAEPPQASESRLRIIVGGRDHTFVTLRRKVAVSHRSIRTGVGQRTAAPTIVGTKPDISRSHCAPACPKRG